MKDFNKADLRKSVEQLDTIKIGKSSKKHSNKVVDGVGYIEKAKVINLIGKLDQIEQPEKPVIPQYVADFIASVKGTGNTIQQVFYLIHTSHKQGIKMLKAEEWINENEKMFARAWLDGFVIEIEQEQLYYAKDKLADVLDNDDEYLIMKEFGEIYLTTRRFGSKLTKFDWGEVGIIEDNAVFEEVDE